MAETSSQDRKRSRSPGYPSFSLEEAIRRADLLYRNEKRNPIPLVVAAEHWGYTPTSSAVLLGVATLKKYGLLEDVGSDEGRLVRLSDLALNILLSGEGTAERATAIRDAALRPKIHASLWEQYGAEPPSDTNLKRTLILNKGFNDDAATDVVRVYKETISYAGVVSGDTPGGLRLLEGPNDAQTNDGERDAKDMSSMQALAPDKPDIMREYSFPLIESADAVLSIPTGLSEENFDLLKEQLDSFFKITRRALIGGLSKQTRLDDDSSD